MDDYMTNFVTKVEEYQKERLGASILMEPECKAVYDLHLAQFVVKFVASIYQKTVLKRNITYGFKPPTFLEWVLRKPREVEIEIDVEDVLKKENIPPHSDGTIRLYEVKIKNKE